MTKDLLHGTDRRWSGFHGALMRRDGSATPMVWRRVLIFGALAALVTYIEMNPRMPNLGVEVAPYEIAGAVLGLFLVLRTNAGYDRWWEGRKLWGSIVNQSRNLAISAVAFGPAEAAWRSRFVRTAALFGHAARRGLRDQPGLPEGPVLVGAEAAERIRSSPQPALAVVAAMAALLVEARGLGLDSFAYIQLDRERALLVDHLGACERIKKTPLPTAYTIQITRFIYLFMATLPFALVQKVGWLTPLITMLVAYPVLALDQIGLELQRPFAANSLNHLPLDEITARLEESMLVTLVEGERG